MSAHAERDEREGEGGGQGEGPDATAVLARERRQGIVAGVAGLASVVAVFVAVAVAIAASGRNEQGRPPPLDAGAPSNGVDSARRLVDFGTYQTEQAIAATARAVGLLAVIVLGLYLYRVVSAREPGVHRRGRWLAIAGPVAVAVATLFGYFVLSGIAYDFVIAGSQSPARASVVMSDSSALRVANVLDILSRLVLAAWIGVASLDAMRVGLLTRFLAYFGIGAAGALVILPIGDAMFVAWVASVSVLALGYWPGGRPPAWRTLKPQSPEAF